MTFTKEQYQTAIWLLVGIGLILLFVILGPVLMPFVTGAILAYILNPLVDRLCRLKFGKWRFPRSLAALVAMVTLFCCIIAIILIVFPLVKKEIPLLQAQIPIFLDQLQATLAPKLLEYNIQLPAESTNFKQLFSDQFADGGQHVLSSVLASAKVGGTALLSLLADVLLIPMVLYYLLLDWHAILERLGLFIPRRWASQATDLINETNDLLAQYLRGQLLVMFILAVYYSIALQLAGFSVALPVGILTGLLAFIPYIGFSICLCLAIISAVLQPDAINAVLMVAIIYSLGQVVESFYLTPRLVGKRIGLPPLAVIFALLAFGQLFGFVGVLLALPASAITSVAFKHVRALYYRSRFYTST